MKIAHVLSVAKKTGGGERVAVDLANQAAEAGHDVWLVVGWSVDAAQQQDEFHPRVRVDFISGHASVIRRYLSAVTWMMKHRKELVELDILHCHLTFGSVFGVLTTAMRWLTKCHRPTVVETYHTVGMPISRWKRWVHSRLSRTRDGIILMAEDDYWRRFRKESRLLTTLIPNGTQLFDRNTIDSHAVATFRNELGFSDKTRCVVGTVGMLRPSRQPLLFVPIFKALADELGDDVEFVMAGSGPEMGRLQTCIAEHGLTEQIKLPGLVLSPETAMCVIDLYITVNVEEATGVAAMQAASLGVPVIAIQFQDGYQASADDWIWSSTSLDDVSGRAIQLLQSAEERRSLGLRQQEHVRSHHSINSMVAAYYRFYQQAMKRRDLTVSQSSSITEE